MLAIRTRELLRKYGLRLKKSLGQNFLLDANVLQKIVDAAEITPTSVVVEIGPGIGALTEFLVQEAGLVLALEIDQRLVGVMHELFAQCSTLKVIHADILTVNLAALTSTHVQDGQQLHVVANLPYYITSPTIIKLLRELPSFVKIVVMMQKEVAERMLAKPGSKEYGYLTVVVSYFATVKKVMSVSRQLFFPQPNVDSVVVALSPIKTRPSLDNEDFFWEVVRASFSNRRKKLVNSLAANLQLSLARDKLPLVLQKIGIDANRRGETLHMEEFVALATELQKYRME